MSDIFENTFSKHKQLLFESISDQNWEDRVDWDKIAKSVDFKDTVLLEDFFSLKKEENTNRTQRFVNHTTKRFKQDFEKLPPKIQKQSKALFQLFARDPYNPQLRFHRLNPIQKNYVAASAGGNAYRSVGQMVQDSQNPDLIHIYWFFIGGHSDYDNLTRKL